MIIANLPEASYNISNWLVGVLLSAILAWGTYITTSIHTYRNEMQTISERLVRIETKMDMMLENRSK